MNTSRFAIFPRRPALSVSSDWVRPDDDEYQALLEAVGFISDKQFDTEQSVHHSIIKQDLNDLELLLLPAFFEVHQKAIYYHNRFHLYHWLFVIGIFWTIVFGTLALFLVASGHSFTIFFSPGDMRIQSNTVFGLPGLLSTAIAVYAHVAGNQSELRRNWHHNRHMVERLRSIYYQYLTHLAPFDKDTRFQQLRQAVDEVSLAGQTSNASDYSLLPRQHTRREPFNPADITYLFDFYCQKRIESVHAFYRNRTKEYEATARLSVNISFTLLLIAVLFAMIWILSDQPWPPMMSAILLALVLVRFTFQWLYGWDRQINFCSHILARLERMRTLIASAGDWDEQAMIEGFPKLVAESEAILDEASNQLELMEGNIICQSRRAGMFEIEPVFGAVPSGHQYECDIFMVMPFAEEFTPLYRDVIVPMVRHEMNLTIKRGDDFFSEHAIMQDIWGAIYASKVVIVECTGRNANVFYELGIAHTLGKPAIMITQNIEDTPFDLRHLRIIVYENTPAGLDNLHQQLSDAITKLYKIYGSDLIRKGLE